MKRMDSNIVPQLPSLNWTLILAKKREKNFDRRGFKTSAHRAFCVWHFLLKPLYFFVVMPSSLKPCLMLVVVVVVIPATPCFYSFWNVAHNFFVVFNQHLQLSISDWLQHFRVVFCHTANTIQLTRTPKILNTSSKRYMIGNLSKSLVGLVLMPAATLDQLQQIETRPIENYH